MNWSENGHLKLKTGITIRVKYPPYNRRTVLYSICILLAPLIPLDALQDCKSFRLVSVLGHCTEAEVATLNFVVEGSPLCLTQT